jgi:hypothetical protein
LIVPLAVIATAAAGYAAASLQTRQYRAESFVVVTSKPTNRDPGQAYDASRLALTLSASLPKDQRLLTHIANAVVTPVDEVRDDFSVVNDTDTGFLRLRFRHEDPDFAAAGARAAADGVTGRRPVASGVERGTLELVRRAGVPERKSSGLLFGTLIGAVLGLGLGLVLLLAWQRADPRLLRAEDCLELTDVPTTQLDGITPVAGLTLLERWHELGRRPAVRVAIVPLSAELKELADAVARWLGGGQGAEQASGRFDGPRTDGPPGQVEELAADSSLALVSGEPPGGPTAGEMEALRSNVVVLLVNRGAKARRVAQVVEMLDQFGHPLDWILFVSSTRASRKRFQSQETPSAGAEVEQETPATTRS